MSDNLQSNVLFVAPDGSIGAQLEGGLLLHGQADPPGGLPLPETQAVTWTKDGTPEGALVAQAAAYYTTSTEFATLELLTQSPDGTQQAFVALAAKNAAAGGHGVLQVQAGSGPLVTLARDDGATSFLQLLSAQQLQLASGIASVTWPGGSQNSNLTTITHNIGRTPGIVLGAGQVSSGGPWVVTTAINVNATQAGIAGYALPGTPNAGTSVGITWVAIG